jgi:hypothetical protein
VDFINVEIAAGYHEVDPNANELLSGIYFYRIPVNVFTVINRMALSRQLNYSSQQLR